MLKNKKYILVAVVVFLILAAFGFFEGKKYFPKSETPSVFSFSGSGQTGKSVLEEANPMKNSKSPVWWLNSGGIMNIYESEFSTNTGDLPKDSKWRKLYKENNSRDTEKGYQPQNIFRLVSRSQWENSTQQLYFKIEKINLSDSEYRNESNGVLLFNRYQDGDNLYYTGLRVDGHAVIKKKIEGKYYTLAEKKVLTERNKYDRNDSPNLIPENTWIGIKSEVRSMGEDTVNIKLYIDREGKGDWKLVLEVEDKGDKYGKEPIFDQGYGGIRTDFMDVKFRDYKIEEK